MSQNKVHIISTEDLGNGKRRATLRVDATQVTDYMNVLREAGAEVTTDEGIKIGRGSVRNRYDTLSGAYPMTSIQNPYTYAFSYLPSDPHEKMRFAYELYHYEPVVGAAIDMMVDFSASGFTNECEDQDVKKLFDAWCKEVKMNDLIESIFLEFYRSGNVTVYRNEKMATVTKTQKTPSKRIKKSDQFKFPAGYTVLNPMNVYVEGLLMFNHEVLTLQMNETVMNLMRGEFPDYMLTSIPDQFLKAVRSGNSRIFLDPKYTSRITWKKQSYERYATPFLERVFEPVLYKRKLREMDMSTIEGLINQLVTVTVGNDEFPAGDEDLNAIAELFNTPNKAYTVFWNHTLQVTFHKPEGLEMLTQDKYKQVNEDIMTGIGVSRVLIDGQGANFSTAWVSILSLIERLDNARNKVKDWLESEYKRIAEENKLPAYPTVRFNNMNLREDTYIRDVLLAMYDRGLIDAEDVLTETGREYSAVVEMKKRNEKNDKLFYPPEQPFQGGNAGPNGGGRPSGGGGNYKSNRKTKTSPSNGNPPKPKSSKATASNYSLEEDYENELSETYTSIQADIIKLVDEHKDRDRDIRDTVLMATIFAMFKSLQHVSDRYIKAAVDDELEYYDLEDDSVVANVRDDLMKWNNSYITKLANDIKDKIITNMEKGLEPDDAVVHAFQTNSYRVNLMAQSGIVESVREAKIQANKSVGNRYAQWVAHADDKTCATCSGLDGQQFSIDSVPPRPHANCRCDLHFS